MGLRPEILDKEVGAAHAGWFPAAIRGAACNGRWVPAPDLNRKDNVRTRIKLWFCLAMSGATASGLVAGFHTGGGWTWN